METLEGNKLIAAFLGYKFAGDGNTMHFNITKPNEEHWFCAAWYLEDHIKHMQDNLKFDTDWNQLMPACYKFDNLLEKFEDKQTYQQYCNTMDEVVSLYKIEPVWRCLVEAIQWYNSQTQPQKQ